jgi:hypothetical protein
MRRVNIVALLGCALAAAPALAKGPEIFPLSQVRKGQKGYGLTVFEGTKAERFEFEVVGVLKKALPKQDLILVRSGDQKIIERGFARGMSGSPLFIEGKVACAFSYGFPFSKGQIGGCTPIEYMLEDSRKPLRGMEKAALASAEEWDKLQPLKRAIAAFDGEIDRGPGDAWLLRAPLPTPPSQPVASYGSEGSLARAGIPLSIAGVSRQGFDTLKRVFEPFGIEPVQGVSGGGDPTRGPQKYEMGAAIGGVLTRGDVSMVGTGTVSYIDGKTISAFGHPFFQMGETYMPATTAEIHAVVPSTNMAFKLSSPLRPLGTLIQDRQASITIDSGRTVDMVPVEIRIKSPNGQEILKSEVLRHRFLTPPLVGMMVVEAARLLAPDVTDTTVTIDSKLYIKGFGPLSFRDYQYSPDGVGGAITGARALRVLTPLVFNPFAPVRIERVEVDVTIEYKADYTDIDGMRVADLELPYGKKTYVDVVLRPYAGKPYTERIPITIPERLAGEQVKVEVVPGDMARPDIAPPESLDDVMDALKKTYPANTLVVTIYTPDEGVTLGGKVIPNLPDSALDTARPATSTRRGEAYKSITRTVVPSKRVVQGRAELTIKVQDKK